MGFTKLSDSIFGSSIMEEPEHIRLFWVLMLAAADRSGVVDVTRPALCRKFNMPREEVDAAIDVLEAPDHESRSPAEDGRRIVRLDERLEFGWRIVNYARFNDATEPAPRRLARSAAPESPRDVYLMRNPSSGLYKIGFSKSPEERAKQIRWQLQGDEVEVVAASPTAEYRRIERLYHGIFEPESQGGEWFDLGKEQVMFVITTLTEGVDEHLETLQQALEDRHAIDVVVSRKSAELIQ